MTYQVRLLLDFWEEACNIVYVHNQDPTTAASRHFAVYSIVTVYTSHIVVARNYIRNPFFKGIKFYDRSKRCFIISHDVIYLEQIIHHVEQSKLNGVVQSENFMIRDRENFEHMKIFLRKMFKN